MLDSNHLPTLERGEHLRQHGIGPQCIIITKHGDGGARVIDTQDHLIALVGLDDGDDLDAELALGVDGAGQRLQSRFGRGDGDKDDLVRVIAEPGGQGNLDLLPRVDGGHDDGDISVGLVARMLSGLQGLVEGVRQDLV